MPVLSESVPPASGSLSGSNQLTSGYGFKTRHFRRFLTNIAFNSLTSKIGRLCPLVQARGRFPRAESEIERSGIEELAHLLNIALPQGDALGLSERTAERHRAEIRAYLGFHEATVADAEMLTA